MPTFPRRWLGRLGFRAIWIVASYAVFATLWIYFSDTLLGLLKADPERLVRWSVYKGLAFVAVTSGLLLLLMRRAYGALQTGYTVLQAQQVEIERLNRLYAALTHINQAIAKLDRREELFEGVCQILVNEGGFTLAWIGWHDPDTHRLLPVTVAGDENDYIKNIQVYTDDRSEGRGPSGAAFRSGQPYICNDLLGDPATLPWRSEIVRRGFRASAALPIRVGGRVAGILNVYSKVSAFFQGRELALLEEAVADLSFALDHLERKEEHRLAEIRASNEKRFSNTMIESMPGVVYFYDTQGRFLRWNRNFEVVTGYSSAEIARMQPLDFFLEANKPLLAERIAEVFTKGESSVEAPFVARDGSCTPYFFTGRRVEFEGRTCLLGVGIDISVRMQAEQALRVLNQTLELEVAARTAELKSALVRAESADRIKSAFLATMSHELRTPLNSIIGFTGILLQGLAGPLNPEQAKQLGMVRGSARHLLELINDVLDISKIEAGQLEVRSEPFDLAAAIDRVITSVKPHADKKGLILESNIPPELKEMIGDRRRVEQILLNLIHNAIKFTDRGRVSLNVEPLDTFQASPDTPPSPAVRMRVADTGIGIKPDDLNQLFQPFRQVDTGLTRQHEGTGLGLAICRRLAALLGGTISVESRWQHGSEFTIVLPLQPSSPP